MEKPKTAEVCNTQSCTIANPDSFDLIQWETITIKKSDLAANDVYEPGATLKTTVYNTELAVGGTATVSGDLITFTSTDIVGNPAYFTYTITDSRGNTSTGRANFNIQRLPNIDAYIMHTAELEVFMENFTPPSLKEVFDTWGRFSDINKYYGPGVTPSGEAACWKMSSATQFICTKNTDNPVGFVSPNSYEKFTLQAKLSSTDSDDDIVGLIAGFTQIDGVNHALVAYRQCGGQIGANYDLALAHLTYASGKVSTTYLKSHKGAPIHVPGKTTANATNTGWNKMGPTYLKIIRRPDSVTVYSTPWKQTTANNYSAGTTLVLNYADYPEISFMNEPLPYGFVCHSQLNSTWSEVSFQGGDLSVDEIYDVEKNEVWRYSYTNTAWEKTDLTIQEAIGYPRTVVSASDGVIYAVEKNSITKIS